MGEACLVWHSGSRGSSPLHRLLVASSSPLHEETSSQHTDTEARIMGEGALDTWGPCLLAATVMGLGGQTPSPLLLSSRLWVRLNPQSHCCPDHRAG